MSKSYPKTIIVSKLVLDAIRRIGPRPGHKFIEISTLRPDGFYDTPVDDETIELIEARRTSASESHDDILMRFLFGSRPS